MNVGWAKSGGVLPAASALLGIGLTAYLSLKVIVGGDQSHILYTAILVAALAGLLHWRFAALFLLVAVCFEGTLLRMYWGQATTVLLAKSVVAAGAYVGFFVEMGRRGISPFRRIPFMGPLALMFALSVVYVVNPSIPSPAVAAIGFGLLWGFVPMYFLGYYLLDSTRGVTRLLLFLAVVSLVVTATGMRQFFLGPAAFTTLDAEQLNDFAYWWVGSESGQGYFRPPATFTFTLGFGLYLLLMAPVLLGLLTSRLQMVERIVVAAAAALVLADTMLNGSRSLYIVTTLELLFMLAALKGRRERIGFIAGAVVLLAAVYPFTWQMFVDRATTIPGNIGLRMGYILGQGPMLALSSSVIGHGAGTATSAARRFSSRVYFPESYFLKLLWEYGLVGTVVFMVMIAAVFWHSVMDQRAIQNPQLRRIGAGLLAAIAGSVLNVFLMGLDFTPMNVYFWFFAGVLHRLRDLDREKAEEANVLERLDVTPSRISSRRGETVAYQSRVTAPRE